MKSKSLYVAATNQHVGKTTSTLGLVSAFVKHGVNVGYCKPVGQQFLDINQMRLDKDTLLFGELLGLELVPEIHSPVILETGATTAFLDDPGSFHFEQDIIYARDRLMSTHELVIFEGTGHPGVGSVVNLNNAQVAQLVGASVLMIVEGGIGSTIDRLNLSLSLFREQGVPVVGVIINKVMPDKLEKVRNYVGKKLEEMKLPLLGVMPYDESLAYPIISTVADSINGNVIRNQDQSGRQVEDIMPGSLIDINRLKKSKNILLVVGADRVNGAIHKIDLLSQVNDLQQSPLAGIVATGEGDINQASMDYIMKHRVPLIRTHLDTFGSVIKISRIEVKINLSTPWKMDKAIHLIEKNIDIPRLIESLQVKVVI